MLYISSGDLERKCLLGLCEGFLSRIGTTFPGQIFFISVSIRLCDWLGKARSQVVVKRVNIPNQSVTLD